MTIRIIGGTFRGRKLGTVAGRATRPMLGRVREAVFDILGDEVCDAEVWDLFAGTGANGIEALSRGARRVVFVEKAGAALRVLRDNLDAVCGSDGALRHAVIRADGWDPPVIAPAAGSGGPEVRPDLVFFDPPYRIVAAEATRAVARAGAIVRRLAATGRLVFHFRAGVLDEDDLREAGRTDLRRWGTTAVAFVRPEPGATFRT